MRLWMKIKTQNYFKKREAVQPLHRTNALAHNHCGIHATPRRFSPRNENQPSVTFADQQKLCSPAAAQQEAERKLKGRKKMDWKYKLFDSAKLDWGGRGKKLISAKDWLAQQVLQHWVVEPLVYRKQPSTHETQLQHFDTAKLILQSCL